MLKTSRVLATLSAAFALSAFAASAVLAAGPAVVGLVDGKTLVTIDPQSRAVTSSVSIASAEPLVGIDVRPSDGQLYGLTANGQLLTIDAKTGKTTQKSALSEKPAEVIAVDFNPQADKLRVISHNGSASARVSVDDGKVTADAKLHFKEGDANAGKTPKVVAAAYTNSMKGAKETALYDIDLACNCLVKQDPPNEGTLQTVGALGATLAQPVAFNITSLDNENQAWLASGDTLYQVNLETGKAEAAGKIEGLKGKLQDIAWVEEAM